MPGQRWCRACFTEYRREQRARAPQSPSVPSEPAATRFWCRQYPFFCLKVRSVGLVRFQEGLLETADPQVIAAIRRNDWYGGIVQAGEPPLDPPRAAPPTVERRPAYRPVVPRRVIGDW